MASPNEPVVTKGCVTEIIEYGAFVKLEDGSSGLIHISEISDDYVYDVREYLTIGMDVDVAVIGTHDGGRKRLSIKQANVILPKLARSAMTKKPTKKERDEKKAAKKQLLKDKQAENARRLIECPPDDVSAIHSNNVSFDDKLKKYIKDSDEKLVDVKHQTDSKRGISHKHN